MTHQNKHLEKTNNLVMHVKNTESGIFGKLTEKATELLKA